ncbi:hypothetical protein BDEG_27677 [Batrachochytrium dendrobatidis JEL423]|uniref:DNA-directed DNA polymerase n=1 Tax=Batrachochytrium dendrobatidis (strain JEL423) TaxID=403673 RepID=A0A177WX02_BATDL|nr:hypothetical protein BDEG_27677 [Batrachochytrium dendrobatidis JEL423]
MLGVESSMTADESLLTRPKDVNDNQQLFRIQTDINTDNTQFSIKGLNYASQYASLYFVRLNLLRPRVLAAAQKRWSTVSSLPQHVPRVVDVQTGVLCYIIGTVFLDMSEKPNILDEVSREEWTALPTPKNKYVSEKDAVLLEDESGRIVLTGDIIKTTVFMTGVIAALLGSENQEGEFQVLDVCYAAFDPQPPLPISTDSDHPWIALVSGLNFEGDGQYDMRYELLRDFLTGESGTFQDQLKISHISRLVICGNTMAQLHVSAETLQKAKLKFHGPDPNEYNEWVVDTVDQFLVSVGQSMPVDVVPGATDPTTSFLPQQPIHSSIFHSACNLTSLSMVTNPYTATVGGTRQSLDDMYKMTNVAEGVDLASEVLKWGHVAPTAPDTLPCYPFSQNDPMVITVRPHLYIIGNQTKFDTKVIELCGDGEPTLETTRVILVPSFSNTGTVVLVNLATLDYKTVEFGTCI